MPYLVSRSKTVQTINQRQHTFSEHTFVAGEDVKVEVILNGVKSLTTLGLEVIQADVDSLPPGHVFKPLVKVSMVPVVDRG